MAADTIMNTTEDENDKEKIAARLHKILGSCSINFLFGAGVNGRAFPFFAQFKATITRMNELGLPGSNIESALQACKDESKRLTVLNTFIDEFNGKKYELEHPSLLNLRGLLSATHRAVGMAENRHPESKRINIFTLNYDRIVEELLENSGYFNYVLKRETRAFLPFNVVGYNTETRAFIPTYAIYKLHGSVGADRILKPEGIVFPGQDKLGSIISDFYETLFAMKGELLRKNAALFVIGYSWSDDHINDVIDSAIDNGLTVVFPQYSEGGNIPLKHADTVIVIPPAEPNADRELCDTTKTLAELFEKAMQ